MLVCVPVKDMRDATRFTETMESSTGLAAVTKNGFNQFVAIRSEDYGRLEAELARASQSLLYISFIRDGIAPDWRNNEL